MDPKRPFPESDAKSNIYAYQSIQCQSVRRYVDGLNVEGMAHLVPTYQKCLFITGEDAGDKNLKKIVQNYIDNIQ